MRARRPLTLRVALLYGLVGCCALGAVVTSAQNTGRRMGLLPTVTATATPGPTRTPAPTRTPEPTRTPVPSSTPRPTSTPNATVAAIATQTSLGVAPRGSICPPEAPIKGNIRDREPRRGERIYHVPGGASYDVTDPERCFTSRADAESAGYRAAER